MARRFAAPGLAVVALLASFGGAGGLGSLVLLAAIVAGAVRLLETVGDAAEGRGDRFPVAMAGTGLVWLVAAGVTHLPLLLLGVLACVGFELLGDLDARSKEAVDPIELVESPVSRAA